MQRDHKITWTTFPRAQRVVSAAPAALALPDDLGAALNRFPPREVHRGAFTAEESSFLVATRRSTWYFWTASSLSIR